MHVEAEAEAGAYTLARVTGASDIPFDSVPGPVPAAPVGDRSWPGHVDLDGGGTTIFTGSGWGSPGTATTPARSGTGTFRLLISYGSVEGVRRRKVASPEVVVITTT